MRALAKNDDGAIVVSAVFASAFLIGALWYLLGVGDAILFKERMQDGADAIAFAPSVVHARGMNLISLLNLVMAAVLAVLVAVKIVQGLLLVANVLACLIPFNPDCAYLSHHESPFVKFVKKVDSRVAQINGSLDATATTVARTTPLLAARRGVDAVKDYGPMVEGGFAASISLVPGETERSFGGELADTGRGTRLRLGLPVEDDDFGNLCHHSGTLQEIVFVPTTLHFLPDGSVMVGKILQYTAALFEAYVRRDPGHFCGSGGSVSLSAVSAGGATEAEVATKVCAGVGDKDAQKECASGVGSALGGLGAASALGTTKPVSKRIYGPARHGNDYFATWGVSSSSFIEKDQRGEKGIDVATWGERADGTDLSDGELDRRLRQVQIAKSEFYYDPRRSGPRGWDGIRDEALWNLRWRARIRRVSQPNGDLARFFAGPGLGAIAGGNAGGGADVGGVVSTVLAARPSELAAWGDKNVGPIKKTQRTGGIVH